MLKQCPQCGCPMAKALGHDRYNCGACGYYVDGHLGHMLRDWGLSASVYGEDAKGDKEYLTTLPMTKFVDGELRGLYGDLVETDEATPTADATATDAAIDAIRRHSLSQWFTRIRYPTKAPPPRPPPPQAVPAPVVRCWKCGDEDPEDSGRGAQYRLLMCGGPQDARRLCPECATQARVWLNSQLGRPDGIIAEEAAEQKAQARALRRHEIALGLRRGREPRIVAGVCAPDLLDPRGK